MKLILGSNQDPAAKNICEQLLELYDFEKHEYPNSYISGQTLLLLIEEEATKITKLPFDVEEVVVASRHTSETGKPCLTVHVPGELELRELALASPPTVKSAIKALALARDELKLPHVVSLEATHHGPTKLDTPVTFVEIGSKPEDWRNKSAGEAVARAIMKAATNPLKCLSAVGLGGPHYAPRHTDVSLRSGIGIGHVLPKYAKIDEGLIELAILRTYKGVDLLVMDWKGLGEGQRTVCKKVAEDLGIGAERSGDIVSREKL